jgi:hypothetical protein
VTSHGPASPALNEPLMSQLNAALQPAARLLCDVYYPRAV